MATTHTIIKDTPLLTIIKQTIDANDHGTVIDLTHAKTVYIGGNAVCKYVLPNVDSSGVPIDATGAVFTEITPGDEIDTTQGGGSAHAGRIGEKMMPPFLALTHGTVTSTTGTKTYYIHITNRLYGAGVGESIGTAGSRHTSTSHG